MASKRDLKKRIKYICGDLAGECIIAKLMIPGINAEMMDEIVFDIATLQTTTLKRVSFIYDKSKKEFGDVKSYNLARTQYFAEAYKKLIAEFNAGVTNIVVSMNKARPTAK